METTPLYDKALIEAFLRRNTPLHLYGLGDLDERFWPWTSWYGLVADGQIRAIALLYRGLTTPTLLALADAELPELEELVRDLCARLPGRFYTHVSPGLAEVLRQRYQLEAHGLHDKMVLKDASRVAVAQTGGIVALTPQDAPRVMELYDRSYPGNWFEPQMLDTGQYFGLEEAGRLVSIAGVHVYSPTYRVAALGNIATDPDFRGRGYARAVTAALCHNLFRTVEQIGLNVKSDNEPAIACYRGLGFQRCAQYEEYLAAAR
jgi:ribosomal protein S18 acetylase RimI-like enzyme